MGLPKDDLDAIDLGTVLGQQEQRCSVFARLLDARAKEMSAAGLDEGASLASLLSDVCAYGLKHDDGREPYGPLARGDGWRTTSIEDLDDAQLDRLAAVHELIAIADLRARVSDVVFVRRRRQNFGAVALEAYLTSAAQQLTPTDSVEASYRLERALMLTTSLKRERERVVKTIVDAIHARQPEGGFFAAKMMQALLEQRLGDATAMASLAEQCAVIAETEQDWNRAREYRLLQAGWNHRAGNESAAIEAKRAAAAAYVGLADAAGSRSLEGEFLERAIQSLRTIGGSQERVEQLHERLVAAERDSIREFKEHSRPIELGEQPARARAFVSGTSLAEAIMKMSLLWRPREVSEIQVRISRIVNTETAAS